MLKVNPKKKERKH